MKDADKPNDIDQLRRENDKLISNLHDECGNHEGTKRKLAESQQSWEEQRKTIAKHDEWVREMCRALDIAGEGHSWRNVALEKAKSLRDECDEWKNLVLDTVEVLGFERHGYCAVVDEVRKLKENEQGDHTSFARKVLAIFDEHPDNKQLVLNRINGLKSKATSQDSQIKQMDEALEQSLMEIAQQAGVIAQLRDELKRAQNSIDDLMYDAANLNGQKEALERALQIVGGRR